METLSYIVKNLLVEASGENQFISIVDDELDLVYLFKEALSTIKGVDVLAFTDPILALEHFQINHLNYRCVVSDFRMPAMNGAELLDKIKQINPEVKRVLISAFEIEDGIFKNYQCIDKYLQKPILMTELIREVKNIVSSVKVEQQKSY